MPASRRSVSRAPSPHGATPAAASACHAASARVGRHHDLEAVLAGVAGARDEHARPASSGRSAPTNGFSAALARLACRAAPATPSRARSAPARRSSRDRCAASARGCGARSREELAEPRDVLVRGARVDDDAEPVLAQEIDDEIVEHAAVRPQQARVERLAGLLQLVDVVGERLAQEIAGAAPVRSTARMCDTSNMPASRRTAWCSSICEP